MLSTLVSTTTDLEVCGSETVEFAQKHDSCDLNLFKNYSHLSIFFCFFLFLRFLYTERPRRIDPQVGRTPKTPQAVLGQAAELVFWLQSLVGQGETGGFFIWKLLPNWWVFQGSGYWATKGVEKLVSCTNSWIPSRKWCVLWGSRHWENLWIHHQHQFVSPILLWHDFRLYVRCPNGAWSWARREDLYNISLQQALTSNPNRNPGDFLITMITQWKWASLVHIRCRVWMGGQPEKTLTEAGEKLIKRGQDSKDWARLATSSESGCTRQVEHGGESIWRLVTCSWFQWVLATCHVAEGMSLPPTPFSGKFRTCFLYGQKGQHFPLKQLQLWEKRLAKQDPGHCSLSLQCLGFMSIWS